MTSVKRSHTDYRVGWICALPKEQTAATAMLDEIHPNLHKPSNDTNTYTLGSIGPHNVVIACLPKGRSGNGSATNVATLMIGSFPSIKIGLLVGIGGGVPSKVRLGDVVVSTPGGQYPGVVQWDFGKATNGIFERIGALNNPPSSLLTALAKLETEYELEGSKIPRFLEELKEKYPMLPKGYFESDSLRDLLFRADYSHVNGPFMDAKGPTDGIAEKSQEEAVEEGPEEGGEVCQFCDQTKIVKRDHQPIRVHHGLIASGNKVVEDGLYRDKLNDTLGGNVLCFEMEAAGLMNNFPCLVIRGICDYCDSHKNKTWQEYAAAVAAAYAKELLGCIQPSNVEDEQLIRDVINEEEKLELMETSGRKEDKKKQEEILDWLTSLDFHLLQNDYFRKCQQDTGQEFINSTEVQRWISTAKQTLFSKGDPGAGKTFQMAILVNHLLENFNQENVGVAYLYYNYKTQQNQKPEHMLASLVKQLAQSSKIFPKGLYQLRDRHSPTKTRPFLGELSNALENVIQSFSRVYILIDALDEGDDDDRTTFLREMFAIQAKTKLNLFATSRPISAIGAVFKGSISKAISPSQEDVFLFLNARMSGLPQFVIDDTTLQGEVRVAIESAIGGMFLLAQLYMNALMGKRSPDALREALRDLPHASSSKDKTSVLNQAYDKSMERIQQLKGDMSSDGLFIISWIVNAKRQLKLTELQEALAIAIHTNKSESLLAVNIRAFKLNKDSIPTVDHITESCASLVIVEGDIVKLVHYTAQEYFERSPHSSMTNFHENLMTICMTYLSFSGFRDKSCRSKEDLDKRIGKNPFYSYAAEFWAYHANEAINRGLEASRVIEFLEKGQTRRLWYQDLLYGHSQEAFRPEFIPDRLTALHVAAFLGMRQVAAELTVKGSSPNSTDSLLRTPMWWAAWSGHIQLVKFLHDETSDFEARDMEYGSTPLLIAARRGYEKIVEWLLHKYGLESKDSSGWTSLNVAAQFGKKAVFDLLIKKGANTEANDNHFQTPLAIAAMNGRMDAVSWLVEKRACIEAKDSKKRTPLMLATIGKHEDVIRYLLENGANMQAMDDDNQTPLTMVIKGRDKGTIGLFTNTGDYINSIMENRYTPLTMTISEGDDDTTKWLIEQGVNLDKQDGYEMTPLLTAIEKQNNDAIKLLIEKGAGCEVKGSLDGDTPLISATRKNHGDIVELLIQKGAVLEAQTERLSGTALIYAARAGYTNIIQSLIEKGANVEAGDQYGNTPLSEAAAWDQVGAIQLLLTNNAMIETKNNDGHTPLCRAAKLGRTGAIELLLAKKANIEARDNNGRTPLGLTAEFWKPRSTKLLLDNNSDAEVKDNNGRTPLMIAVTSLQLGSTYVQELVGCSYLGFTRHRTDETDECVKLLLDSNVDLEVTDDSGFTALVWAIRGGRRSITKLLLNYRANTSYRDASGRTLMHIAVERRNLDQVEVLLEFETVGADEKDDNGRTPLSRAMEYKEEAIVKALLDSGKVDVNTKDDKGWTPLRYIIELKYVPIMKTLLGYKMVDVNTKDDKGRTPLLRAVELGDSSIVKALLDSRRPDVNARDIERRTPLRYAIEKGDESIIRVLLDCKNVGIHKKDNEGYTPLLYAMKHKKKSIIQLLFHKGRISANTRDKKGRTPLSHATGLGDRSLVKALLDFAEVEIDAKDNKGRTPLTYATSCSVAKVLLRTQKVDVNSRDKQGRTPIWYATQAGNHKLVELLVRRGAYDGSNARNIRRWVDNGARLVFTSSGGISLWNWIRSSPLLPRFSYFAHHFLTWSALS